MLNTLFSLEYLTTMQKTKQKETKTKRNNNNNKTRKKVVKVAKYKDECLSSPVSQSSF